MILFAPHTSKCPRVFSMTRMVALSLCLFVLPLFLPACGGGGGSEGDNRPIGELRVFGVSGDALPGPTVGNFAAFPSKPLMAAAENGWSALVAPTDVIAAPNVLLVMDPNGNIVEAFAEGDAAPAPSDGDISGFLAVWMSRDGRVTTLVSMTNDTLAAPGPRTFGVLSAEVSGGVVMNKMAVIYEHDDVNGTPDTLATIDAGTMLVSDLGELWFKGASSAGLDEHLYAVSADGTTVREMALVGGSLPSGAGTIQSVDAFGVDREANFVAFVAFASLAGERRIYLADASAPGAPVYDELAQDGEAFLLEPGSINDVHTGGPILLDSLGTVAWMAEGSAGGTDDVLLLTNATAAGPGIFARSGDVAPQSGGGFFGDLNLLRQSPNVSLPTFSAEVTGGAINFSTYHVVSQNSAVPPAISIFDGRPAPGPVGGGVFGTTFPGLDQPPYQHVARNGSFVFAQVLNNGETGLFWLIPFVGLFEIAVEGQPSPLAGQNFMTFNAAPPQGATTANSQVLFRAELTGGNTAVFRQGQ